MVNTKRLNCAVTFGAQLAESYTSQPVPAAASGSHLAILAGICISIKNARPCEIRLLCHQMTKQMLCTTATNAGLTYKRWRRTGAAILAACINTPNTLFSPTSALPHNPDPNLKVNGVMADWGGGTAIGPGGMSTRHSVKLHAPHHDPNGWGRRLPRVEVSIRNQYSLLGGSG